MMNWSLKKKGFILLRNFLTARRLMYWQVYLHKTSLVAEQMITRILKRAKELTHKGVKLEASSALRFFLNSDTLNAISLMLLRSINFHLLMIMISCQL